jgi:protein TonB
MWSGRGSDPVAGVLPVWFLPAAYILVSAAHAVAILSFPWPSYPEAVVPNPVQISIVARGASAPPSVRPGDQISEVRASETQPVANALQEVEPVEAQPSTEVALASPTEAPPTARPDQPVEDIPSLERQDVTPSELAPLERPKEQEPVPQAHRPKPEPVATERKPHIQKEPAGAPRSKAAARVASVGSSGTTTARTDGILSANYRSLVIAELNRRKRYPEAARAARAQGIAIVAFTIGPSGRVTSHSITRSSGNGVLDNEVHVIMGAVSLPPPPGGSFRATAPISFSIR